MLRTARYVAAVLTATAALPAVAAAHGSHHGHGQGQGQGQGRGQVLKVGPGDSIQAAIDRARPGATILVRGHHRENVLITKDGITLKGLGAVLSRPAQPAANACYDPSTPEDVNGICILGDVDFATGEVRRAVRDVTVKGFRAHGFYSAIIAVGAHRPTFARNVVWDNDDYGLAVFSSTGARILRNRAIDSGEAALYVGDSTNAVVARNVGARSELGLLLRSTVGGVVWGNVLRENCAGIVQLADAPGPAGDYLIARNRVVDNSRACPAGEEGPGLSGIGIGILGGSGNVIVRNVVARNVPGGPTPFQGGVVVRTGFGGTAATDNRVVRNRIARNAPDISWDGAGTGNVFRKNRCSTSTPAGLCR